MLHAFLIVICAAVISYPAHAQDAGALRKRHAELRAQLGDNPFGRPLHVESSVAGGAHKGEIYAVIEQRFDAVAKALARPEHWCDILKLQVNIKRCSASEGRLTAMVTRKPRDTVDDAHRVDFGYRVAAATADYLRVALSAPEGPLGTRDYEIQLEAAPLDSRRTFIHMSYAYTLGFMARRAMDAYLAGTGRDKRGFSVDGGERGVVERSAMRYYLAVEAFLDSLAAPASERLERRVRDWYAAISRYPQLQEQVGKFRPGDKVAVTILRAGEEKVLDMTLRGRNGTTTTAATVCTTRMTSSIPSLKTERDNGSGLTTSVQFVERRSAAGRREADRQLGRPTK